MSQCVEHLQQLGFALNEAKVYLALLQYNPVTGYELSNKSGIRRSLVYDVLNRLIARGAVYTIAEDPVKYMPVPYDKFLDTVKRDFEHSIETIKEELDQAALPHSLEYIYHIKGARNVRSEMLQIIEQAERELLLELWMPQVGDVRGALAGAQGRGVSIHTMLFTSTRVENPGHNFYHDYMPLEVVATRLKGHHTIVVRDNQEALIGKMLDEDTSWAVTTRDPALVMVAREFIIHDIMIDLLIREFGKDKLIKIWMSNPDIHGIVHERFTDGTQSAASGDPE
ncbi:MAG: hypothetical protein JXQ83_13800 [Candidatus Glassbacteria bacterium]|nr:hypothetical protein [Candidatus Glassbacteria bacterium]